MAIFPNQPSSFAQPGAYKANLETWQQALNDPNAPGNQTNISAINQAAGNLSSSNNSNPVSNMYQTQLQPTLDQQQQSQDNANLQATISNQQAQLQEQYLNQNAQNQLGQLGLSQQGIGISQTGLNQEQQYQNYQNQLAGQEYGLTQQGFGLQQQGLGLQEALTGIAGQEVGLQGQSLNNSIAQEAQQYGLTSGQTAANYGFQQQGFGLQQQGLGLTSAENAYANQQALRNLQSQGVSSGSMLTGGHQQDIQNQNQQYAFTKQGENLNQQNLNLGEKQAASNYGYTTQQQALTHHYNVLGEGIAQQQQGLNEQKQGIAQQQNQLSQKNLNLSEAQSQLQRQSQLSRENYTSEQLQNQQRQLGLAAQSNGLSQQAVNERLNYSLQNLGLSNLLNINDIYQGMADSAAGVPSQIANLIGPLMFASGLNIPGLTIGP